MPIAKVNGCEIFYEMTGNGPALVFIHGEDHGIEMFAGQVAAFRGNHRCLTYDRRGHGKSELHALWLFASQPDARSRGAAGPSRNRAPGAGRGGDGDDHRGELCARISRPGARACAGVLVRARRLPADGKAAGQKIHHDLRRAAHADVRNPARRAASRVSSSTSSARATRSCRFCPRTPWCASGRCE